MGGGVAQARPRVRRPTRAGRASGASLNGVERELLADILNRAPEVVHLLSGHGLEDAALVQAGAKSVVGVDYSSTAAGGAQRRVGELGLACRYIVGTVPGVPLADGTADLVYTGKGALIWMPDLDAWAREAARLLRPGGHLFVYEGHPAVPLWTWDEDKPGIRADRSYFARLGNGTAARHRVRWAVDGREHCKSFKARPLADGFLDGLKDAVRDRRPFSPRTGLPGAENTEGEMITWYAHARAYAEAKWGSLAPVSRRSVAEALATVTVALAAKEPGAPEPKVLRQALFSWAFNPATRDTDPPPKIADALDWAERASLPVAELEDTATVRLALAACARNLSGKAAAGSTQRRKRSVFYNALGYAVEQGHLPSNPVDRIQWTTPAVAQSVDRRVVVSPAQARSLLAAVRALSGRGQHLEAFFACLYYAALRPSEAVMLRESDLYLPKKGWGRIVLAASASRAGTAWTDDGTARQERGLKHRADNETRTIPIPPELVRLLRAYIKRYGTTPDGRIFQTARGGILQDSGYNEVWTEARKTALTPAQYRSPLGRRPYDLRHAAVSLWLNSGVPATEVARRAGHGVAVLLKIYAHCIDGQADAANQRITDALGTTESEPGPGDEGDADSEPAA